jgi:hypothetical protein
LQIFTWILTAFSILQIAGVYVAVYPFRGGVFSVGLASLICQILKVAVSLLYLLSPSFKKKHQINLLRGKPLQKRQIYSFYDGVSKLSLLLLIPFSAHIGLNQQAVISTLGTLSELATYISIGMGYSLVRNTF